MAGSIWLILTRLPTGVVIEFEKLRSTQSVVCRSGEAREAVHARSTSPN